MKTNFSRPANGGLTVVEMLVVIACAVILAAMILPPRHSPEYSFTARCRMNLKQIGVEFLIYADDNHGKFPLQTSITNGGTLEYFDRNQTFPHYQKFSTNIDTACLVCPTDKTRKPAANFAALTDTNISYFLNGDVSTNNPSQSILSGDRHLQVNGRPVTHGTLVLAKNTNAGWTSELHQGRGVLGFTDGHAEFCRSIDLNSIIQRQGLATNRFSVP